MKSETKFSSINFSNVDSDKPSIFIAFFETKCFNIPSSLPLHEGFLQTKTFVLLLISTDVSALQNGQILG